MFYFVESEAISCLYTCGILQFTCSDLFCWEPDQGRVNKTEAHSPFLLGNNPGGGGKTQPQGCPREFTVVCDRKIHCFFSPQQLVITAILNCIVYTVVYSHCLLLPFAQVVAGVYKREGAGHTEWFKGCLKR